MKNYMITFSSFISEAMGACKCNEVLACNGSPDTFDEKWKNENGCEHSANPSAKIACKYLRAINNYNKTYNVSLCEMKITETEFWKEYLQHFNVSGIDFNIPKRLKNQFDWKLLYRLIIASFSCQYSTDALFNTLSDNKPELTLTASSGDTTIVKNISECYSFQIKRLYELFFEEMIQLSVLHKDNQEMDLIQHERNIRLEKWQQIRKQLDFKKTFREEFYKTTAN